MPVGYHPYNFEALICITVFGGQLIKIIRVSSDVG
jgi:hypothetical protein